MKTLLQLLCCTFLLGLTNFSYAQTPLQCVSDLTWEVSGTGPMGPFNVPPVEVIPACLEPIIISCVCPNNTLPNIGTCEEALEIWGEDPTCVDNVPCTYPTGTYWFHKVIEIDECEEFTDYHIQIQGDNNLTFFLNGVNVLQTGSAQWNTTFDTNGGTAADQAFNTAVGNALVPGPNDILIRVANVGDACMNYAFLSFCADFIVEDLDLDANFTLNSLDNADGTFNLVGTAINPTPNTNHEWYLFNRPYGSTDPHQPLGFLTGFPNLNFLSPYCQDYMVIHREFIGDCEECYRKFNGGVCEGPELDGNNGDSEETREIVPCDILGEFRWRRIETGGNDGEGRGEIQSNRKYSNLVSIAPNPAKESVSLIWDIAESQSLQIFAIDGRKVLDQALESGQTYMELNVSSWNNGIYIVQLQEENGKRHTKRFEVIK